MASKPIQNRSPFGALQVALLLVLMAAGPMLSLVMRGVLANRPELTPSQGTSTINFVLWIIGGILYAGIAGAISKRIPETGLGLVFGFFIQSVLCVLMALVLNSRNMDFVTLIGQIHGELWGFRVLAMVLTALILALPLQSLFSLSAPPPPMVAAGPRAVARPTGGTRSSGRTAFSFSQPTADEVNLKIGAATPKKPTVEPVADSGYLSPPEGFVPSPPADGVLGMVNLPHQVILESVPEAAAGLSPSLNIRVRLAYFVPQLPRCTVWLTWGQVFSKMAEEPGDPETPAIDMSFRDRWIRIPPKYYVTQVPKEFFVRNPITPAWVRKPAVPQEALFDLGE